MKSHYKAAKVSWIMKYGTTKRLPHHMNSILVQARDAFKVYSGNIIRDRFVKTNIPSLIPPNFTTNTQVCVASIQVYSII